MEENKSNKILLVLEVNDGYDFKDTYDQVVAKMFKNEAIVEGCYIEKIYLPDYNPQNIIENIRKQINQTLDSIKNNW